MERVGTGQPVTDTRDPATARYHGDANAGAWLRCVGAAAVGGWGVAECPGHAATGYGVVDRGTDYCPKSTRLVAGSTCTVAPSARRSQRSIEVGAGDAGGW